MKKRSDFAVQFGCLVAYHGKDSEVVIPDGVTEIGRRAFYFNMQLKSVTIPESVTTVETEAFEYCVNLQEIRFLGSVQKAGKDAFGLLSMGSGKELAVCGAVPIRAFGKTAQAEALERFVRRFSELDPGTETFRSNLRFLGAGLKQPQAFDGMLLRALADNDALRHAVFDAGAIARRDVERLLQAAQEEGNAAFAAELLEYQNRKLPG